MGNATIEKEPRVPSKNNHFLILVSLILIILIYIFSTFDLETIIYNQKLHVFKMIFTSILIEAMPFILIGVFVSALLQVFVSEEMINKFIPKNPVLAIIVACVLGIIFPICECGMIPAIRKLIKKGMPLFIAVTFILTGPILNPVVFLSTLTAFRNQEIVAYARMGLAFAVALVVGLIIFRFVKSNALRNNLAIVQKVEFQKTDEQGTPVKTKRTAKAKFLEVMGHTTSEFFEMGKYLIFGSIIVALLQTFVAQSSLLELGNSGAGANLVMMGLGFILSLCSTSDAFVAQAFQTTFTTSSLLGLMVFGPMINLKGILMMLAVFKTGFVILLCTLVFVFVFIGTLVLPFFI